MLRISTPPSHRYRDAGDEDKRGEHDAGARAETKARPERKIAREMAEPVDEAATDRRHQRRSAGKTASSRAENEPAPHEKERNDRGQRDQRAYRIAPVRGPGARATKPRQRDRDDGGERGLLRKQRGKHAGERHDQRAGSRRLRVIERRAQRDEHEQRREQIEPRRPPERRAEYRGMQRERERAKQSGNAFESARADHAEQREAHRDVQQHVAERVREIIGAEQRLPEPERGEAERTENRARHRKIVIVHEQRPRRADQARERELHEVVATPEAVQTRPVDERDQHRKDEGNEGAPEGHGFPTALDQLDLAQAFLQVLVRGDRLRIAARMRRVDARGSTSITKSGFGCRKNGTE